MLDYRQIAETKKNWEALRQRYIEFCQEAGLKIESRNPSGISFYLSFLFQPFRLYKQLFLSAGVFPALSLSFHLGTPGFDQSLFSINAEESSRYVRQILAISFVTVLISLLAALIWGKPTLFFVIFVLIALAIFFLEVHLSRLRGCLNYSAVAILIALITWAYQVALARNYLIGPRPAVLALGLILVSLSQRIASARVIALFTTIAAVILKSALVANGGKNSPVLVVIGCLLGMVWHSADILTKDEDPPWWRYIVVPIMFLVLLFILDLGFLKLQFTNQHVGSKEIVHSQSLMLMGFLPGYSRGIESALINLYQLILYLVERLLGWSTIHLSAIKYHDAHFMNLPSIPHLLYAYRREPDQAKQVLNYCIISPNSLFVRLEVLRKLRPDAFLSLNSKNRPEGRKLAELLTQEGLSIWYDEVELILGRSNWEKEIDTAIKYAKTALILVGSEGYGSFQQHEVDACMREHKKREFHIIPLILPKALLQDDRLTQFTFVDLRNDDETMLFESSVIKRLKLGITGKRL